MSQRKPISKMRRFEIFKRDGFTCQYCGATPPRVLLHVDHIVAVAAGGENDDDNLITACEPCNLGKGARDLRVAPESLADKAARVAEAEAQLIGINEILQARRERIEDQAWEVVDALTGETSIKRDRLVSIKRFIEKLGVNDVLEAAELARAARIYNDNGVFRYFCAVCWNKIREGEQ
ncbi:HNH endonuclease [Brevundimonas sp. BAL450]|uniref:HNH endonuclease n=1 Tax=Brevundimonas sp. BAL450 TaxID=1708162 RepID=UPI0018CBD821|nr:HNH endonuclease [Brevundimonas sp. BAL450]